MPFSEKFPFRSKVQNVELKLNHCLHRDVITQRKRGNSDPGNPTFSGVSEGNTTIVSLSLQGNTDRITQVAVRDTKNPTLGNPVLPGVNLKTRWGNASGVYVHTNKCMHNAYIYI